MTRPLIIAAHTIDGVLRLDVAGEVDLAVADDLREAIDKALAGDRAAELIIDFGAVTFLDSAGISALLAGRAQALCPGLRLSGHQPPWRGPPRPDRHRRPGDILTGTAS
jgi:anti-anti-sigma factor